jgi:hypothetical protein
MKYPLRVIDCPNIVPRIAVADASGKIICGVMDEEWGEHFARFIVSAANLWPWRRWFRPYTREDWVWEKNLPRDPTLVG